MKTLKNLFGKKESTHSINNFANHLAFTEMIMIKGGEGDETDDDDTWPPSTTGSGN